MPGANAAQTRRKRRFHHRRSHALPSHGLGLLSRSFFRSSRLCYFGLRSFGLAYGFGFSSFVLAGALGTYIMGAGFDRTHSYSAPLLLVLFAMFLATILFARLGPYRFAPASSTALRVTAPASEVAL